eukprot:gb/GECG01008247.1/.p1 GENE.gb/GECG01008247.1/~~gb/GECG01008247.1/.p1  ORF type:complete len:379 (+),score=58.80 gb/GECG01008247.1/:1-1137(+)
MARYIIAGRADDEKFAHAQRLGQLLLANLPDVRVTTHLAHPDDWETGYVPYLKRKFDEKKLPLYDHGLVASPFVYTEDDVIVGGEWEFSAEVSDTYGIRLDLDGPAIREATKVNMKEAEASKRQRELLKTMKSSPKGKDTGTEPGKRGFVVVDAQNDFCKDGGLEVPNGDEVIPVINRLRDSVKWDVIALTQDWHPQDHMSFASNNPGKEVFTVANIPGIGEQMMWPDHCVQGSRGAEFHPHLETSENDVIVKKGMQQDVDSYSGFGDALGHTKEKTILEDELKSRNVEDVFVAGLALDYCVAFTCKDSAKAGFNTYLILDGARGISEETINKEKAEMEKLGVHFIESADIPSRNVEHDIDAPVTVNQQETPMARELR